jgi:4-amino-4-deoxy-L-arabinose transferase-like glycosyltransferase
VVRALYVWLARGAQGGPDPAAAPFDAVAWSLARGTGFALDAGARPTALVPPVVPWLAGLLYRVAGHRYLAALLLQCALGALVPLLLTALGAPLFGLSVGRLAGWFAVVHPLLVTSAGDLTATTAAAATLVLALVASVEWMKTPRRGRATGTGLLWGLAGLTRPDLLALVPVVAAWAWSPLGLTVASRERARLVALLLLGVALGVGPWLVRDAVVLNAFVPVTTSGGREFLAGNNPAAWVDPASRGGPVEVAAEEPWAARLAAAGEPRADAMARDGAWAFLAGHVPEWPAMAAAKLARFWWPAAGIAGARRDAGGTAGQPGRVLDPLALSSALFLPFALWGALRTLRGARRWFQSLPLLAILWACGLAVLFYGAPAVRAPVEPLIALYAASGVESLRQGLRARRRGLRVVAGKD